MRDKSPFPRTREGVPRRVMYYSPGAVVEQDGLSIERTTTDPLPLIGDKTQLSAKNQKQTHNYPTTRIS